MLIYNLGQDIWRYFHVLAQFLFTTSETELQYYHQRVSVQVASRVVKILKAFDFRKLGNFKKILGILGVDGEYLVRHPKA